MNGKVKIILGASYISILTLLSLFAENVLPNHHTEIIRNMYNDEGELVATVPFSPIQFPPFGTNEVGQSLLYNVLDGAKFTIFFTLMIALCRIFISFFMAIGYSQLNSSLSQGFKRVIEIAYFIPPVFIIFFILGTMMNQSNSSIIDLSYLGVQVFLLLLIGIPPLILLFGEEMKNINQRDFISIVKLSGVGRLYVAKKHIWPIMKPKILITFLQQVIQLLILLIHLGILHIFIGGSRVVNMDMAQKVQKNLSLSNEWGGLIGVDYQMIQHHPWIVLVPLLAFTTLIGSLKLILSGLQGSIRE